MAKALFLNILADTGNGECEGACASAAEGIRYAFAAQTGLRQVYRPSQNLPMGGKRRHFLGVGKYE